MSSSSFRLTPYFLLASLIGIAIVLPSLFYYNRSIAFEDLMEHETRSNEALTRAFSNSVWARYSPYIAKTPGMSRALLLSQPETSALHREVVSQMHGLPVVKVKLYNLNGDTVFSTDAKQIGENERDEEGFKKAILGTTISGITFRGKFNAIEGEINDRDLISTYIPVRNEQSGGIEGVFEVYSDITALVLDLKNSQIRIAVGVIGGLGFLYVFLFFFVRRADAILRAQGIERAMNEERMRHQAYHDALTGLPNRVGFGERLSKAVHNSRRTGDMFALMFLDLDRFKLVNDSLGHDAGDALLKVVAARILACLRDCDAMFRMGGDEFTILLGELTVPEDIAVVARRIVTALTEPVQVQNQSVATGASIGIVIFPQDGITPEDLVKNADTAMYHAKDSGTGNYSFFRPEMNTRAMDRLTLETELQQAIRNQEFEIYYQPRMNIDTGRVAGVEALLRWHHPERGLLTPAHFIERLEETKLIVAVGEWVLRTACKHSKWMQSLGYPDLCLSVNLSGHQFRPDYLYELVGEALRDSEFAPEYLELELTETTLFQQNERSVVLAEELRILGIRIAVDDFGTGYSSINYLKSFPIDCLKLDRSLIENVASNAEDQAILVTIVSLGKTMGMSLVAEGVETMEQANFLAQLGCHEMQGFLFERPLPLNELPAALEALHRKDSPFRCLMTSARSEPQI